ncbi:CRISPR-associated helicase/endonuclease Cas3 [Pseudofrankia saprophytica]|uniref:CRISPR-associated helicase/endonuclease Cas3 n=1 Tax=Pseudofrankia saprophytica TaxID=298655 RepID=UPI000234B1AB|nr:CRISPR-associated helicase/endonuclease Cas3 [Pseudofrankia saprophytica]
MLESALGVVWGKSDAQGSPHLLLGHLFDTAAVGELIWDRFLAPAVKEHLDGASDGRGRSLFALLCGLHDVGKASPAFQSKDERLAAQVQQAGLTWGPLSRNDSARWHHTKAGASIVWSRFGTAGWSSSAKKWVWPLIAGHHGVIPTAGAALQVQRRLHGEGDVWRQVQDGFVDQVATGLGLEVGAFAELGTPRRGGQLAVSGLIIMADWIASDEKNFRGLSDLADISLDSARERAACAWGKLGLRGGWRSASLVPCATAELVERRFRVPATRPAQATAVQLAQEMPGPGLLILEAPMGEGKTEAALAAAEVLARRFGADGLFVGMPTQATSDPMFSRVREWLASVDPEVPIGLLHGRARFNKEWAALRDHVSFAGVADEQDSYGMDDSYGSTGGSVSVAPDRTAHDGVAAADWFFGGKRGLLAPVTVGTVDQLLHAATRTKHVMLRHAGLAGRVVVLDEVHAYDVYMAQFLFEALRWLADAGVPVVLLSATLPPALRRALVVAYMQGALRQPEIDLSDLPEPSGYPSTTTVCAIDGELNVAVRSDPPWRASETVTVDVLDETEDFAPRTVAEAVLAEIGRDDVAGEPLGCVLVVCNTVARAQDIYEELRPALGDNLVLLHSRFVATERARRTETIVDQLGRPGRQGAAARPRRLVVVATQVAEQSFDVDVDLLVTDLAPIDLLLQRIGRLHRHERPASDRPTRLRRPRVLVSGLRLDPNDRPPTFPRGSQHVYGNHLLLRSAALVRQAASASGWSVPADVPRLVATGYSDDAICPPEWADAISAAEAERNDKESTRRENASAFLLAGKHDLGRPTLDGLHERSTAPLTTDERVAAVVRDGDESVEVVLVCPAQGGGYRTLGGTWLGQHGEVPTHDDAVLEEVVGATIRLPSTRPKLTAAALALRPLDAWGTRRDRDNHHDPWLRHSRALAVDPDPASGEFTAVLGGHHLSYRQDLGLRVTGR